MDEDGKPLGPAVVAHPCRGSYVAEVRGPCRLPAGTIVQCTADVEDGQPPVQANACVDARRGLEAYLFAADVLPVESAVNGHALSPRELGRLRGALPWLCGCAGKPLYTEDDPLESADCGTQLEGAPEEDDALFEMLRECGVDVSDLSDEVQETLRRG